MAPFESGRFAGALLLLLSPSVGEAPQPGAAGRLHTHVILRSGLEKRAMYPFDGGEDFDFVDVEMWPMLLSTSVLVLSILGKT